MKDKTEKTKIGIEIPAKEYRRCKLAKALINKNFQDIVADGLKAELDRLNIPYHPDDQ